MKFNPLLTSLLAEPRLPELGAGRPDVSRKPGLEKSISEAIFGAGEVRDRDLGRACIAGLWLHFDFLEDSHHISQEIHQAEGSYWHGVMHRREGDFANASYWFRRSGILPFQAELGKAAAQLYGGELAAGPLSRLGQGDTWDPFRFVDICKLHVRGDNAITLACRKLQRLEWHYLFSYCYAGAIKMDWKFDLANPGPFQL
jgi:hypothetical protein